MVWRLQHLGVPRFHKLRVGATAGQRVSVLLSNAHLPADRGEERHVRLNAATSRPVGLRWGNIRLLSAPMTKQNRSELDVCLLVCVCPLKGGGL